MSVNKRIGEERERRFNLRPYGACETAVIMPTIPASLRDWYAKIVDSNPKLAFLRDWCAIIDSNAKPLSLRNRLVTIPFSFIIQSVIFGFLSQR